MQTMVRRVDDFVAGGKCPLVGGKSGGRPDMSVRRARLDFAATGILPASHSFMEGELSAFISELKHAAVSSEYLFFGCERPMIKRRRCDRPPVLVVTYRRLHCGRYIGISIAVCVTARRA